MNWFNKKKKENNYKVNYIVMNQLFATFAEFQEGILYEEDNLTKRYFEHACYILRKYFFSHRTIEINKLIEETISNHKGNIYLDNIEHRENVYIDPVFFYSFLTRLCEPNLNPLDKGEILRLLEKEDEKLKLEGVVINQKISDL